MVGRTNAFREKKKTEYREDVVSNLERYAATGVLQKWMVDVNTKHPPKKVEEEEGEQSPLETGRLVDDIELHKDVVLHKGPQKLVEELGAGPEVLTRDKGLEELTKWLSKLEDALQHNDHLTMINTLQEIIPTSFFDLGVLMDYNEDIGEASMRIVDTVGTCISREEEFLMSQLGVDPSVMGELPSDEVEEPESPAGIERTPEEREEIEETTRATRAKRLKADPRVVVPSKVKVVNKKTGKVSHRYARQAWKVRGEKKLSAQEHFVNTRQGQNVADVQSEFVGHFKIWRSEASVGIKMKRLASRTSLTSKERRPKDEGSGMAPR